MKRIEYLAVLALFLFVTYPLIRAMTIVKGRAGMFIWRNQLQHMRGPHWQRKSRKLHL